MSLNPLTGRGAVVAGGSRGIGRAVAELLCDLGAGVVVNGRDPVAVRETVAAISASGGRAASVVGAADDERIARRLIEECTSVFGRHDVLINCAGIAEPPGSSILDIRPAEFNGLMSAHVGTVLHTCQAAAPVMASQGHGSIINTGSAAFLGDHGGTGYPAGKGGVNSLTMAIAAELKPFGVRANVVCPGARTRLSDYSTRRRCGRHWTLLRRRMWLRSMPILPAISARDTTGQIFVAAGGFVGRYDRPTPSLLGYRDHRQTAPWSVDELHTIIGAAATS